MTPFWDSRIVNLAVGPNPLCEFIMPQRSYQWVLFVLAFVGLAADQASKYGMFNWLYEPGKEYGAREVINGVFKFLVQFKEASTADANALVRWNSPVEPQVNHGALFSLGGEFKTNANRFFTIVSALAALGIIAWSFKLSTRTDKWLCIALGLILGGTIGNLFDRIVFGGVRDFLYFYLIDWPIFNVADCCLVCGAILLLLLSLFSNTKPTDAKPTPVTATPTSTPAS